MKKRGRKNKILKIFPTKNRKTGLSPVIATVLLIAIVIVIALIIFLWARGFVKEEGIKFSKNIKLVCQDVEFEASYQDGVLSIVNTGYVPIYRVKLKIFSEGSFRTKELTVADDSWPDFGVKQGETYKTSIPITESRFIIIPVLIGSSGSGQKIYTCEDNYGYEIKL
jgi:FlaG/FlaF family flagellin (archaellin)